MKSYHSGAYSFKSGLIGVDSVAATETTVNVDTAGSVSFWYRVNSEPVNDKLLFYIDGVEKLGGISGSAVWTNVYFPLTAGAHNLKWTYVKNASVSVGEDSAYIDDITISGAATTYTVDCNTCHLSSDTLVINAITNENTNCTACHTQSDHETLHQTGMDTACLTCHLATLTQEHMNNPNTTAGRNYSCDTCHANTGTEYARAIKANNLNCSGCHKTGHNTSIADNVPADIPLYSGFRWSTPVEAAIFVYEPAAPYGYDTGQVVLSNRRTDVNISNIWGFYNGQLAAKGWLLKSGAPAPGDLILTAEFAKEDRLVTVKSYQTESGDGIGQPVSTGYRIELWYKY